MPTQPDVTQQVRKWKYEVNTGTVSVPTWTPIRAVAESTPDVIIPEMEDDDSYDEEGYRTSTKTSLRNTIELKLLRKKNPTTGAFDPGQEALRTKAGLFGVSGMAHVRWYDRTGGAEAYENYFEVEWKADGGNTTDIEKITVTLHGKAAPDTIANPA
jgi:hypothetical protein